MATMTSQRTVRVTNATHRALQDLAAQSGEPMTVVLARAVERYRREQLLRDANDAWVAIMADPVARREIEDADKAWDVTLMDGLEEERW